MTTFKTPSELVDVAPVESLPQTLVLAPDDKVLINGPTNGTRMAAAQYFTGPKGDTGPVGPPGKDAVLPPHEGGELWVGPGNNPNLVTGAGSYLDPRLVSTSAQFDAVLETPGIRTYLLKPGVYYTKGNWVHSGGCVLPDGGNIIGAGMDRTFIALADDAVFESGGAPRRDANILWMGIPYQNSAQYILSDLTLDGNRRAFTDKVIGGVVIWGNHAIVERVRVKSINGDPVPIGGDHNLESFGISLRNSEPVGTWPHEDGGSLISDCWVEDTPDDSYVSGIYPGYRDYGRPLLPTTVQRCKSELGMVRGNNQACFSANHLTAFNDCYGSGGQFGFYNDTGPVRGFIVDRCVIENCRIGVSIKGVLLTDFKRGVSINKSSFRLRGFPLATPNPQEPIGVEVWDNQGGSPLGMLYADWNIVNNAFFGTDIPAGGHFYAVSLLAPVLRSFRFKNNIVPVGTYQHVVAPTPPPVIGENWLEDGTYVPDDFPNG